MDKVRVLAVVGPSASGKTSLAVALAKALDGEIVSCDSMQIYKGMDVASAKPTAAELSAVPHHLIGFLDPESAYSVADFCRDANAAIDDIASRGKLPVLCGGTGLYVDSLLNNITFSESRADKKLRANLLDRAHNEGNAALLKELADVDPEYAARLNLNDTKRIVRALEVYYADGVTMSEQLALSVNEESRFDATLIGLRYADRQLLYDRINMRVDSMLAEGLLDEAYASYQNGSGATASQAIGHKEFFPYFSGDATLEECIEKLKQSTRRYAKRQMSWFNRNKNIHWIDVDTMDDDERLSAAMKIIERAKL